jgi:phosphatidylserine decarboxylase
VSWEQLDEIIESKGNLTKLFGVLKPLCREPIGSARLARLQEYFKHKDRGLSCAANITIQSDACYEGPYASYQDWFTRRLSVRVFDQLKKEAESSVAVIPNECAIESVGVVGDTSSILRLKKPAPTALQDLISLGVPPDYLFVNMKLLTSHYHHIHAPISGEIVRSIPVHSEYPLFGKASINFVEIKGLHKRAFLLIIGEAVVQDFNYSVKVGDRVEMLDFIGNFSWGSQVVMLVSGQTKDFKIKPKEYSFVGRRLL